MLTIGDSAHTVIPHRGRGAPQAVEDGLNLSRLRARDGQPIEAILNVLMARRDDRCKLAPDSSRQIGQWDFERRTDADCIGVSNRVWELNALPVFEDLEP